MSEKASWTGRLLWGLVALAILVVGAQIVLSFWIKSIERKRAAAERNVAMNNLRLIGLGMANYESRNGSYPLTAIYNAKRQPLLSWRVAILRNIGETSLYDQFHLDEPWDSPHNSTLIDKIPSVYSSPGNGSIEKGKTCILAPVGEDVAFPQHEARSRWTIGGFFCKSILIVEVAPSHAVIWTKPDDLIYNAKNPLAGLAGGRPGGFIALYCDGSTHQIPPDTPSEIVNALFSIGGDKRRIPEAL
jgi:hypothetical protein